MDYVLYHHGIKGQKWGVRRFQNKDGSLTNAGKKRYNVNDIEKIVKTVLPSGYVKGGPNPPKMPKEAKGGPNPPKLPGPVVYLGHTKRPKSYKKAQKNTITMTDEELKATISRLELEKRYTDLLKSTYSVSDKKKGSLAKHGKDFVLDVLKESGKDIAKQYVKYVLGTAINNIYGEDIVNPKKGQKDK